VGRRITAATRFRVGLTLISVFAWSGTVWAQAATGASPDPAPQQNVGAETKSSGSESRQAAEDDKNATAARSKEDPSSKTKSPESASPQDTGGQATADEAASKSESGLKFTLQEQSEVWANPLGGGQRGTSYNGLTTASLDLDLDKFFGWKEARLYVSAFDIHGHGPTRSLAGNNQIISNIEATPSLKLYNLWLEQRLFGTLYLRIGQAGANDEMMTTSYGALFLNSSFGFPGLPAADLPSGGPNYPMATPFVRARWKATDKLSVVGAVFNGDPAPPGSGDPQIRDRNGTAFRLNGHSLSFAELRYSPDPDAPEALSTTYKLGSWYHSGRFDDERFDVVGRLLASPSSSGIPRKHRGDFVVYAIADQVLWRRDDAKAEGIGAFVQVQAGSSDRNLSDLFVEGGVNWNAPFHERPDDVAGLSFAYLGISPVARRFSRDLVALGGASFPYATNETVIEATYKARISDRLTLQPDAQLVLNPNAHIPGPFGPKPLSNPLVIGIRVTVSLGSP
jgi:porin